MTIKSMHVLYLGLEANMDKSFITYRVDEGKKVDVVFLSYLIRTDKANILVDAGFHPDDIETMISRGRKINVRPEDQLPQRIKELGLTFGDIDIVVMTHLHTDHAGWLSHLRHAEIIIQKEEYKVAIDPPSYARYTPARYNFPDMKWRMVDGDEILMPGLTALFTPGHTAGSQALMVELPEFGTIILAGDVGDFQENFDKEIIPGLFTDPRQAWLSIRRLKVWSQIRKAPIFTSHDTDYWRQHMKKSPEAYT